MPGIFVAALIIIFLLLFLVSLLIIKHLTNRERLLAIVWMVLSSAAFFGAYYFMRLPLDNSLHILMQNNPIKNHWMASLYAPLTEEPAKWIVLIPLVLSGRIKNLNKAVWAICLGIGFGIGEILFLAQSIAANQQSAGLPWYYSSGFIIERLMVCFIHSAFFLIAIEAIRGRKYWLILLAPAFHWFLNMPIFLSIQYPFKNGGVIWSQLLWTWTTLFLTGSLFYLGSRLFNTKTQKAAIFGSAVCPECQSLYVRPWLGINLIGKRYERCPKCRHNHWTILYNETNNPASE